MKSHEHKYISGTIGDECGFCGLLKSTIESMEKTSDQVWDEALTPMIELLPTPSTGFSQERINSEMQDKINELVKAVNKLNRP